MYWDQLCKLVEKNKMESLFGILARTKLFHIDEPAHQFLKQDFDDDLTTAVENFRMPFPIIALEDPAGIVLIADTQENQFGISGKRLVLDYTHSSAPVTGFDERLNGGPISERDDDDVAMITMGDLTDTVFNGSGYRTNCSIHWVHLFSQGKLVHSMTGRQAHEKLPGGETLDVERNFMAGFQEIIQLMQPKNFTLKTSPKKIRQPGKKIPRSHERSIYTIMKPDEIRKQMGLPENPGNGGPKRPHERAGHYRTLRHERYGDRVGDRIWIKPTWIGPSEAQVGNKFYKVMLNNGSVELGK